MADIKAGMMAEVEASEFGGIPSAHAGMKRSALGIKWPAWGDAHGATACGDQRVFPMKKGNTHTACPVMRICQSVPRGDWSDAPGRIAPAIRSGWPTRGPRRMHMAHAALLAVGVVVLKEAHMETAWTCEVHAARKSVGMAHVGFETACIVIEFGFAK